MRRNFVLLIVAAFLLIVIVAYASGYRPGPGLTAVRSGSLILSGLPRGAVVYADATPRGTSSGADMSIRLVPGSHSIIVDMPGGYPWNDVVTIVAAHDTKAFPINVPKQVTGTPLAAADRALIPTLLKEYKLPSATSPLALAGGCALIMVENNRVLATGTTTSSCTPPPYLCVDGSCGENVVFAPSTPITGILPLPGHPDALLISYGNTVAVTELNPISPQFFAPIFQGAPVRILPWKDNAFVLVHGNAAEAVALP